MWQGSGDGRSPARGAGEQGPMPGSRGWPLQVAGGRRPRSGSRDEVPVQGSGQSPEIRSLQSGFWGPGDLPGTLDFRGIETESLSVLDLHKTKSASWRY